MNKNSGKILVVSLILLLLITTSAAGYFYLQTQKLQSKPAPAPVSSPIVTPSATPTDETVGWKTYTNNKYSYAVKYPIQWSFSEAPDFTLFSLSNCNPCAPRSGQAFIPGDIKIEVYSNGTGFISLPINNYQNTVFSGQKAIEINTDTVSTSPPNSNTSVKTRRIYVDKNGSRYGIAVYLAQTNKDQERLVDQILSTFRFLN